MGFVKSQLAEQEALERVALSLLLEVKALKTCDIHEDAYFNGGEEVENAYRLANYRITRGELDVPEGIDRKTFSSVILKTYEENSVWDFCAICDNNMRE